MIVEPSSISRISVNSKKNSHRTRASPSSSTPQNPEANAANIHTTQSYEQYWSSECNQNKLKSLQKTVQEMQENQNQMQQKFQSCIEQMLRQIQKNNQSNAKLAVQVNRLKTEVTQSKKDILVIQQFLNVNQKREFRKQQYGDQKNSLHRHSSGRDLLGSLSGSKRILLRRQPSKAFKSKLFPKE